MSESSASDELQPVEFIPFNEFKNGLPYGRFRVIVNPKLALKFMRQRLYVTGVCAILVGFGLALAYSGGRWIGAVLVVLGILISRVVKSQASKMLLHLATNDAGVYRQAVEQEILEVRRA